MKLVITGALGHIGSHLIRRMPALFPDADVVLLDNLSTQRYCSLFNLPAGATFRFQQGDIVTEDLGKLFAGAAAVVHLAAITDAESSMKIPEPVEAVNHGGTVRVAEACRAAGVPMVFLSTTSVYGSQAAEVDEDCPADQLKPQSPYAASKLRAEQYLQSRAAEGLRSVIFRFGTIFGASVGMRFHTAVNKFCWQAAMGMPITVWRTSLNQVRPYLDLDDAAEAIALAIRKQLFDARVYNVVTANLTVQDIVDALKRHCEKLEVQLVDAQIMNQLSYRVSGERLGREGFQVHGSLEDAIAGTIALLTSPDGPRLL